MVSQLMFSSDSFPTSSMSLEQPAWLYVVSSWQAQLCLYKQMRWLVFPICYCSSFIKLRVVQYWNVLEHTWAEMPEIEGTNVQDARQVGQSLLRWKGGLALHLLWDRGTFTNTKLVLITSALLLAFGVMVIFIRHYPVFNNMLNPQLPVSPVHRAAG